MKKHILLIASILLSNNISFADSNSMPSESNVNQEKSLHNFAPYPKAESGYKRYVIHLGSIENEHNAKVELMLGKILQSDCNRQIIGGNLDVKNLDDWGYEYYVLSSVSEPVSTRMACPDNNKTPRLTTLQLRNKEFLRYNSKLPIVIYVPKDIQVNYRIWNAKPDLLPALKE